MKKVLAIFLTLALCLSCLPATVFAAADSGTCGDDLTWELTDDGTLTISGTGAMFDYEPEYAPWYSYRDHITSVVVEEGVTSIGSYAFDGCSSLTSIVIPEGVTSIGDSAFSWCSSLTSIMIPDSVTSIGNGAFWQSGLTSVIIPAGVTAIGDDTFSLTGLTSVTIPESVTSIGIRAFYRTSLTSVTIPESVTSIGAEAFSHTDLTSITIPDGVTVISEELFSHCTSLASITIPAGVTSIGDLAFSACDSLTSIVIPEGVTRVGEYAFHSCAGLQKIVFSGNAPMIGTNAFINMTATAFYPDGNATWTADVMQNYGGTITWVAYDTEGVVVSGECGENLTWKLTMDGTLTISGTGAMFDYEPEYAPWYSYRDHITSVVVEEGMTSIGSHAFHACERLTDITIPDSVTSIGTSALDYCTSLTSITIPDSLTSIGDLAFDYCISLTSITIPGSVTSIGNRAFRLCRSLTGITIPASVTNIGAGAFSECDRLNGIWVSESNQNYSSDEDGVLFNKAKTELLQVPASIEGAYTIPAGVTSIGDFAFYGCSNLTSITIPESVTSIGEVAFNSCSSLTNITIPESVTAIGSGAFNCCTSLESITIPEGVTSIEHSTFAICSSLTSITIPSGVTSIGEFAFDACSSLTGITIPEGVTSIEQGAFYSCTSLTSITIPSGVTSIRWNAFADCGSLTEIIFTGDAPTFDSDVFYGVTATAYYPADNTTWVADVMQNYGGTITWEPYQYAHKWGEWTVVTDPTCTEKGTETRTCADCGEIETRDVDALGHVYDAVVTAPTCTERGYTTYTCIDGDHSYVDSYVDALEHKTELQNEKDATCTEAGYTGDQVCTVCDEIVEQGETIDALGHDYDDVVTAPTCTKQGYTTYTCSRCNGSYVDDYVDATGHKGNWIEDVDGTAHRICTICGITENKVSTNGGEVSVDVPSTLAGTTDVEVEHVADTSDERYSQVEDTISEEEEGTVQKVFDINLKDEDGENVQPGNETVTVKLPIEESSDDTEYKVYRVNDDRTTTDMNAQQQGNCMVFETDHFSLYVVVKHTHDYDTVKTAPTCTERGYTTYTCSTCDDSYVDDYVKATGHSFGGWTVTTDPTCTEKGVETGCCAHCDATEIRSVKALGHDLSAATCTEDAKCRREGCDHTEEGTALGHSFTSYRSNNDAGCTTDGTKTAECRRCHDADTVVDKGSAKGHDYAKTWSKGQDGHWHECSVCRDKTDVADHDYGTAGDKCVVCEYQRDHVHRLSLVPAVAADCTTAGNKAYYTCSGCDDWFEDANGSELIEDHNSVIIAELGHKTELQGVKEATCTEDGYTGDQVCTACGETVVKGKTIDALGHDMADATCTEAAKCQRESCDHTEGTALGHQWDDGVVTTEPTEEAEGVKTYTCERCGVTQTESIPALEPTEPEEPTEPSVPSTPVKPVWQSWLEKIFGDWWGDEEEECDHEYASVITEPTCEEKGYTTHTCTKCGDTYKDSYTDALGHQYEDGICTQCGKTEPVKPAKPNWKDILEMLLEWWK